MHGRSSIFVGRQSQTQALSDALAEASAGRGQAVFIVGETGIGKTRLAAVTAGLAVSANMALMRGRGSAIGPMVPYRCLTEAVLTLLRSGETIDVAALGPYRPVLGRLIPEWGEPADGHSSLVLLAEAVLRLTGLAGRGRGCLLALDDLHDADQETLGVVEYLVDNISSQPAVLIGTIRSEPSPALNLARLAARRGACVLLELNRLGPQDVRALAASCLRADPADLPAEVVDALCSDSAGNPFLVEELVQAMVTRGVLARSGEGWQLTGKLHTSVPTAVARDLARRIDQLDRPGHDLLLAAAALGRRFPLPVVQALTGMQDRELLRHLHGQYAAELVGPDDQTPDWYAFTHPLAVEVLLGMLSPAERGQLAARAAVAVEAVYPGLPGEWCPYVAALRLNAGDESGAARLFVEAGRRALAAGAAGSAVAMLDRAREMLARTGDMALRAEAIETLIYALAEAGLVERALTCLDDLDQLGGVLDRSRRAKLHTKLAWAANIAGRTADGLAQVEQARALLGSAATAQDTVAIDVVAAHLALDVPGPDQLHRAESMARHAALVAQEAGLPVEACQAWQLLGAITRGRDPDEATACLERAHSIAVSHQLPIWELHALVRLGNDDAMRDAGTDRLEQARQAAVRVGAVTAGYQADASLALHLTLGGRHPEATRLIEQTLAPTTRLGLRETVQHLLLTRTVLAAHQGRRREMDAAIADFRSAGGELAQHISRVHGLARTFCALLEEDRSRAMDELAHAVAAEEANPTIFPLAGRFGLHLLLSALSGEPEEERHAATPADRLRWNQQFVHFARAVRAGRDGRAAEAESAVQQALQAAAPFTMARHLGLRLICEAALAGSWGEPVVWLRTAEEHFYQQGVQAVASACRTMLRRCGVPVRQRREGAHEIPAALRSAGVTVREYEILRLLVDRLGNREIADRLHLSPRTVEKHVARLIAKTGHADRAALRDSVVSYLP